MNCDRFCDDLELYALGALEHESAKALAEHLATGCATCHQALKQAVEQSHLVSSTVPLVNPPARLRRRLHGAIAPFGAKRWQWLPWAVAATALLLLAIGLPQQFRSSSSARAAEGRLSTALQILEAPGTRSVSFMDPRAPVVRGTLYIHQKLGAALIIDRLPKAPTGWKYESWLVPKVGAPRPIESFQPDSSGRALSLVPGPIDPASTAAIAVSIEPKNSRPVKPTTLVLAART